MFSALSAHKAHDQYAPLHTHYRNEVSQEDVEEAQRLLGCAKSALDKDDAADAAAKRRSNPSSAIFQIMRRFNYALTAVNHLVLCICYQTLTLGFLLFFLTLIFLPSFLLSFYLPGERAMLTGDPSVRVNDVRQLILTRGFNDDQIAVCLGEYERLNIWTVSRTKADVRFVDLESIAS
jgi:hypothetical protein